MGLMSAANPPAPVNTPNNSAFDGRLVQVDIELEPGKFTSFTDLAIFAVGTKFGNAIQNQCEIKIFNLAREQRNYIIKQSSPLKSPRTLINVNLSIGRQSYGKFLLFTGQVTSSDITQPPDIGVVLRSLTSNYLQGAIAATQYSNFAALSTIAQGIAQQGGWTLDNQATDKQIMNFSYTGNPLIGVKKLNDAGGVNAFVDNNTLVILNSTAARKTGPVLISEATGMVGIPQVTQQGVNVTVMINPEIQLGGTVTIDSAMNPAANGTYKVIKINFEIANRDEPFWYILETSNLGYYQGN